MFYNQHVRCQVDYFGYIQVLNNAVQSKLNPETKFVIRGVVDGPIPIPNQNIAGFTFVPGVFNLGQVLCGTTSLKNSSHQSTLAWTLGFQSSGGSNKGAGPAWDISFSSGCGSTTGETESTVTLTQMIQNSIVNRNSESVGIDLVPTGNMFAAPQTITATLYKFYDAQGNLISDATTSTDGQAIKTALIGVYNDPLAAYPYVPFLSAPGWLESYTPEAINAQMDSLLPNLKSPKLIHNARHRGPIISRTSSVRMRMGLWMTPILVGKNTCPFHGNLTERLQPPLSARRPHLPKIPGHSTPKTMSGSPAAWT